MTGIFTTEKNTLFLVGAGWFGWFHKIPKKQKKTKEVGDS
jgi:hypothetical protein